MLEINKSIAVILPNYNGRHLLEKYIPSILEALAFSKITYEFIVVDDCSTDDSVAFIKKHYPNFILLQNEVNSGFSKTCNNGFARASMELIFLVNSDVKLTKNYFEQQFKYFQKQDTFGVMGRIMSFDGNHIEDAARYPRYKLAKFKANSFYYIENQKEEFVNTCYLSGANALIDRKKLELLSGFNEIYSPFYFEDFDLGLRAWKMGWFSYYEHQSICYHHISATTKKIKGSNFVKTIYNRNSFILQSIHLNGIKRVIWHFQLFTITLFAHLVKGEFWIFKSIGQFMTKKKAINNARINFQILQQNHNKKLDLNNIITIFEKAIKGKKTTWLS